MMWIGVADLFLGSDSLIIVTKVWKSAEFVVRVSRKSGFVKCLHTAPMTVIPAFRVLFNTSLTGYSCVLHVRLLCIQQLKLASSTYTKSFSSLMSVESVMANFQLSCCFYRTMLCW